ncbi:MAG: DUF362 domain-containing protein [Deltaproteobacteria bacterium]|nr:DUF362 domain-containing protein [Deltaproteobacteria bacterium]
MARSTVALIRYTHADNSLQKAVELCDGFKNLKANDNVLIKPNLVAWSNKFVISPYGVFTTTRLVEDMVLLLKEFGCEKITIGEGSVPMEKGVGTVAAFKGLGYEELVSRYGVKLLDFNKSKSTHINLYEDFSIPVAREALEADFFINMPVLKTHGAATVSLSIKNLKGAMKIAGKKRCHSPNRHLEHNFPIMAEKLNPQLTVIDGIYMLEKGPLHIGNAFRKDLIIASRDILGADIVGAAVMGIDAKAVKHLSFFASRNEKSIDIADYDIRGLSLNEEIQPIKWDEEWNAENTWPKVLDRIGMSGIAIRKFDDTLCSGCSMTPIMCNLMAASAFKGEPFGNIEVLIGKKMHASPGFDHTLLVGKCIVKANEGNPNIRHGIALKKCPPSLELLVQAFHDVGVEGKPEAFEGYMRKQGSKYDDNPEFDPAFYRA